jgi:hypothetical protein
MKNEFHEDTRETKYQNMTNGNTKLFRYFLVCLSVKYARDIPTGQSKMDNPDRLADRVHTQMTSKTQTQHDMCWTPLFCFSFVSYMYVITYLVFVQ